MKLSSLNPATSRAAGGVFSVLPLAVAPLALLAAWLCIAPLQAVGDVVIPSGSSASNESPTTIAGFLDVFGTYSANATLSLDSYLYLRSGGVFNMNASVSTPAQFYVYGGTLNLNSGTASIGSGLYASSPINRNGGNYSTTTVALYDGVSLTYEAGDAIDGGGGQVALQGASRLTANKPLNVVNIYLAGSSILELTNWSDSWNGFSVAARWRGGNNVATLTGYRDTNLLQFANAPGPVSFQYDAASNTTFITAVPEPSTCAMALAGLACGGYTMFRRRRAR